jgi:hypothetical protein
MGGISLLAASVVVALLGFGWVDAIKDGVFDVWSTLRNLTSLWTDNNDSDPGLSSEEEGDEMDEEEDAVMKEGSADAMEDDGDGTGIKGEIEADPEFDGELNELESQLDALLNESDAELNALEEEI